MKCLTYSIAILILLFGVFAGLSIYAANLSAELMEAGNISGSSELTFADHEDAESDDPWICADQYIWVEFDTTHTYEWQLRIITDNHNDIVDIGNNTPPGIYDPNMDNDGDGNPDGGYTHGGIINVELDEFDNIIDIQEMPDLRITLAWKVYNENFFQIGPNIYYRWHFVSPPNVTGPDGDGIYSDSNIATEFWQDWNTDGEWGYIGDKWDTGYRLGNIDGWYIDLDGDGVDDWPDEHRATYNSLAWGIANGGSYANHPGRETTPLNDVHNIDVNGNGVTEDDGWDLYVYLAGRFWVTAYTDPDNDGVYDTPIYCQVPAGEYRTTIYVELYHL